MFRWSLRGAALALGLLLAVGAGAPEVRACEGADCQAEGKPLDLRKFMREQAASTRTPEAMKQTRGAASRHKHSARSGGAHETFAKTRHSGHRVVAARSHRQSKPEALANDAASADAPQPAAQSDVQVLSADELSDIDRAAGPPTSETMGKASDSAQASQGDALDVQVVVANDFNEIDRRAAEQIQPVTAAGSAVGEVAPHAERSAMSWMQWLWSAVGAGFIALAGLARYLSA